MSSEPSSDLQRVQSMANATAATTVVHGAVAETCGLSNTTGNGLSNIMLSQDVSQIAEKVRELEKSTPCQLDHVPEGAVEVHRSSGGSEVVHDVLCGTNASALSTMLSSGVRDDGNSQKSITATSDDRLIVGSSDSRTITGTSASGHVCGSSSPPMNDVEIKALVKELKRKIERMERMDWLCLSRRWTGPPHRKTSLAKHQEVKKRFLEICDNVFNDEVRAALRLPAFDCYEFDDASIICLMQTMFVELDLPSHFNIPMSTLRQWLYEVYKHYNDVPFHNFRHCFCVTQMMYAIAWKTNLVNRLGHLEVLILLVSCICHDLDHPGYNNIYQINARTELALRYNDISPLENHHCSIAFRLLEHPDSNLFQSFSKEAFKEIREGIIRCILATDMARHNEIITQFKDITSTFDYTNKAHTNLMCMVLIKVADISNEARPLDVAEPWLDRLLQEFFAQSAAEKQEGLPVTPFMDPEKVSRTGSQVRFIGLVLLPLFETLGAILTELNEFIIQPARVALDYYKKLNESQTRSRRSIADTEYSSEGGGSSPQMPRSQSGISVRSKKSIPSQKSVSISRTSVDEPMCVAAELHDLPEGSESGDSETATEVDVAEKASKFKVDTESSGRSKSSQPPSRKTSKEKRPSMCVEMYNSSRIRGSYGNIHSSQRFGANRAVSLDAQCQSRRMSSEGIQSVISDSSVFYHAHPSHNNCNTNNRHNVHHVSCVHHHADSNNPSHSHAPDPEELSSSAPFVTHPISTGEGSHPSITPAASSRAVVIAPDKSSGGSKKKTKREFRFRSLRGSSSPPPTSSTTINSSAIFIPPVQSEGKPGNNSIVHQFSASNANNPPVSSGSRSFISRLRQLTGKFNFTFDHGSAATQSASPANKIPITAASQKVADEARGVPTAAAASHKNVNLRNESAKNLNNKKLLNEFGSKQLCNISYAQQRSPNASKRKNTMNVEDSSTTTVVCAQPAASLRSRAYSLDVPTKRYSSGSSSRKSSSSNKNEDEGFLAAYTPNNNNGATCITCSYCSAELVINPENNTSTNGTRARHININVNNWIGGGGEELGVVAGDTGNHICTIPGCDGSGSGTGTNNSGSRKASDEDNEIARLMNNRMTSNNNLNNNHNISSSNSNLSKNVNI